MKPLEEKILQDFGCTKFIYCSDAGLGSEKIKKVKSCRRTCFHRNTVDQKLNKDDKAWALDKTGFKRVSDNLPVDLSKISMMMIWDCIIKMHLILPIHYNSG